MVKRILMLYLLMLLSFAMIAQQVTTNGSIVDENDQPLAGVSIQVKGTSQGTISDYDGKFNITTPSNAILQFSFIGFEPLEAPAQSDFLKIILKEDLILMDELVVTALGMKKEKKALAYSVTELKDDAFLVKESNLMAGLAGKVAGINVVKPTTGSMGSSRIVIRGNGSFGNNQPLYIVDGMPISNSTYGQPGTWGGFDGGDGISSINSDDIESMTVLKGGTAAALYGSRAANGAIIITTKQGKKGKASLEITSSYTLDSPVVKYSDFQYEYGQGLLGATPQTLEMAKLSGPSSWGGKLDGSDVIQFDGVKRPYTNVGRNNIRNFYNNAWSLNNTVSIAGGTDDIQYRIAVGDQRIDDLYPNSGMVRNNGSLNLSTKLSSKVSLQTQVMYMRERVKNRQNVNDYSANGNVLLWTMPPNIDVRNMSPAVNANGDELLLSDIYVYFSNPYFIAYNRKQQDAKDRLFSTISLRYDIDNNFYLTARAGGDMIYRRSEVITPKGTGYDKEGSISTGSSFGGEANLESIFGYESKGSSEWQINAFTGWNSMMTWSESISAYGSKFIQPNLNVMGNTQGLNQWGLPATRSLGLNLNIKF